MYTYNITQWLSFFIIYSFLGWVWECCYVSVRKKQWVNRGFMHGPMLPIYGSGAVIVLFAALPFKGNVVAVYIAGMIAASILEYCTGAAMEAIFKVRYWDYSNNKFNLNGHICLFCSLGWGFFSVAMVYVLHNPFERIVLSIPENILSPLTHVIMMIASADYGISFKTAIELRDVLIRLENARHEMQLLQKRVEVYEAFLADDIQHRREKYEEELRELQENLRKRREAIVDKGEAASEHLRQQLHKEHEDARKRAAEIRGRLELRTYLKPGHEKLLLRNPTAVSSMHRQTLERLKQEYLEHREERKKS